MISITQQKSASMSQVNLQKIPITLLVLKISVLNIFTDEWEKLRVFLTQLKLFIEFNTDKFWTKMNKKMFIISYLKNTAFNWINLRLHEFLNKIFRKWKNNKKSIFNDFKQFKKELRKVFEIINEKWAAKWWLHTLW